MKDLVDLSVFSKSWSPDDITSLEGTDIDSLITTMHRPNYLYQNHYLALISPLLINWTRKLVVVFILPCPLTVIKLFIANSILKLNILHHMKGQPRIINAQMKIQSTKYFIKLIGIFVLLTKMSMNKSLFLTELWLMFFFKFYPKWSSYIPLTLIREEFLGVRLTMGGKLTSCLKFVRILIETWNLVRKQTHT